MKRKELNDIKELGINELEKKEAALRRELLTARFARQNQQLKNPLKLRELKKDIARVQTILQGKGEK